MAFMKILYAFRALFGWASFFSFLQKGSKRVDLSCPSWRNFCHQLFTVFRLLDCDDCELLILLQGQVALQNYISDQKVTFVVTVSDFVSLSLCAWKNHQEELGMHGETFVLFWLADSLCHSLIGCWDQTLNISISKVANQSTVVCVGIFLYCYTLLAVPGNYFLRFWGKNPSSWRMGRAAAILVLLIHKIVS